ncbi:MAG: prealbumin-like fold domain-containing protein, partial [Oscillospiraceae bacterium]|nr:prealbumin-like fold domain-containing protein [Oscillospiraceae bacterium]
MRYFDRIQLNRLSKAIRTNGRRVAVFLLAFTLMATAIAFAISGTYAQEGDAPDVDKETAAEQEDGDSDFEADIYIIVDEDGNVTIAPADVDYTVERDEDDNIRIMLPPGLDRDGITATLPEGWEYVFGAEGETQDEAQETEEEYPEDEYTIVIIVPPLNLENFPDENDTPDVDTEAETDTEPEDGYSSEDDAPSTNTEADTEQENDTSEDYTPDLALTSPDAERTQKSGDDWAEILLDADGNLVENWEEILLEYQSRHYLLPMPLTPGVITQSYQIWNNAGLGSFIPYPNPPLPPITSTTPIYSVFVRPRYGHIKVGWPIPPGTGHFDEATTFTRNVGMHMGAAYYRGNLFDAGPNARFMNSLFIEIEISGLRDLGTRVVGYTTNPSEIATLTNNSVFAALPAGFIPTVPTAEPFPVTPPPSPIMSGQDNFNLVIPPSSVFSISTQTVEIRGGEPRDTAAVGVTAQLGLGIGTHPEAVLIRHGPAVVGELDITFRVVRPVRRVELTNQNRPDTELDATLTVRDYWPSDPDVVDYGDLPLMPGLSYTYDDPTDRRTSDIIVTIPKPPDGYTYFDDPSGTTNYIYTTIEVVPPPGYTEVPNTRHLDSEGNLVVQLRPIMEPFAFYKFIYPNLNDRLENAEFYLYWWCVVADDWVAIAGPILSDANGLVDFDDIADVRLTIAGTYRLRETDVPAGYHLP